MSKQIKKHGKTVLILGLVLTLAMMYELTLLAQASTEIDNREIKISDSRSGTIATSVTYDFEGDHTVADVKCLEIEFCNAASGDCVAPTGMAAAGATKGTSGDWAIWTHGSWLIGTSMDPNKIWYYFDTGEGSGLATDNRSFSFNGITNPTTAGSSYFARIKTYPTGSVAGGCTGTVVDEGVAAFYVIAGVDVTATVVETLTFTITGKTAATCEAITNSDKEVDTSATGVPFGDTGGDEFIDACQSLTVGTNASGGYSTTVQELDQLKDGSGNTITSVNGGDGSCDGACTETTAAIWATDTNNGFAYCMSDHHAGAAGDAAVTAGWNTAEECGDDPPKFQVFPENDVDGTDTEVIMSSDTNLATNDISYIGYRLSADPLSVAAAYSNILVFVTTPTY